jgi:hypothetical protein
LFFFVFFTASNGNRNAFFSNTKKSPGAATIDSLISASTLKILHHAMCRISNLPQADIYRADARPHSWTTTLELSPSDWRHFLRVTILKMVD